MRTASTPPSAARAATRRSRGRVAERDHVAELPGGIDVQQRERRLAGREGLQGQVQHHAAVLADRIEHHRPFELGGDLADDVDALGLEGLELGQGFHGAARIPQGPDLRPQTTASAKDYAQYHSRHSDREPP